MMSEAPFWPDIDCFYSADERRRFSSELDFGVMWRDGERSWPSYRVSWVEATGDFYAECLAGENRGQIEHLGRVEGRSAAERALDGWAYVQPMTLDWVRGRMP